MIYIKCFLVGGLICAFAQIIIDKFKLMPIHITCLYVVIGCAFSVNNIYNKLINFCGYGASLPISSFGNSLTVSALNEARNLGYLGIFKGMFDSTAPGIIFVIIISFIFALIFKPKG